MATKVVQQVQLQGWSEVVAQLNQLGKSGTEAFQAIGQAAGKAAPGLNAAGDAAANAHKRTREGAREAANAFAEFGERGRSAFEGLSRSAEGLLGSLSQLSAGGLVAGFESLASGATRAAGALGPLG